MHWQSPSSTLVTLITRLVPMLLKRGVVRYASPVFLDSLKVLLQYLYTACYTVRRISINGYDKVHKQMVMANQLAYFVFFHFVAICLACKG